MASALRPAGSPRSRHSSTTCRPIAAYPGDIEAEVSPARLKRFFHRENGGYRIRTEVRDLVVFAPHNILSDPPFSRLDLIACRNLLIYLERDVQRDVIELFHYALNPEGMLLLGTAESVDATDLFRTDDKRLCLFRKRNVPTREPRLPVFPLTRSRLPGDGGHRTEPAIEPIAYGKLHQQMVERLALRISRQRLQSIIEEYETAQEEMKASSEEMQSTNEELRSTMEELETSKEELQSINVE